MKGSVATFSRGGVICVLTPSCSHPQPLTLATTHTTSVVLKLKAQIIVKVN